MIQVSKSFLVNGQAKTTTFSIKKHGNFKTFAKNAKISAQFLAEKHGGKVSFCQDANKLYINYMDVPNTNKIDTCYMLV